MVQAAAQCENIVAEVTFQFWAILGNFGQFWAIFGHFNIIVQAYLSNYIFHSVIMRQIKKT